MQARNRTFSVAVASLFLVFLSQKGFSAISDCKNPSQVVLDANVKMRFCEIPAASNVLIGSQSRDLESPVFGRNFLSFQIGQFEVTQQQYKAIMGETPWRFSDGHLKKYVKEAADHPAVYIDYHKAVQFTNVLNLIDTSATYRLPTEAEWEYAARGKTTTEFYWGNDFDANYVFYYGNIASSGAYAQSVNECPQALLNARFPGYCANGFGLMHMLGNVIEWTADAWTPDYSDAPTDGNQVIGGSPDSRRTLRGGCWGNKNASIFRSAMRGGYEPMSPSNCVLGECIGFRVVRFPKN